MASCMYCLAFLLIQTFVTCPIHAYERSSRVYDYTLDPCGPVHITTCDVGNQENMVAEYADEPSNRQPEYNAYRESSFGYDILE
ncbi:purple acid phosphatase 15, partial [Tanacetum coccineum]